MNSEKTTLVTCCHWGYQYNAKNFILSWQLEYSYILINEQLSHRLPIIVVDPWGLNGIYYRLLPK